MPVPIIPVSLSAAAQKNAKINTKKLAEIRERILSLL